MEQTKEKIAVKVILVGDGAVGKTSLRRRYMGQGFSVSYIETVGADFASKTVEVEPHQVHLSIWDLASQSIYRGMRSTFYKGASIVIVVYDVSALVSFKSVHFWLEEAMRLTSDTIKTLLLVGNKSDLDDLRQVSTEEGELAAKELAEISKVPVRFIETSALTGENIEEAFYLISKEYVESIGVEIFEQKTKTDEKIGDISHIPTTDGLTLSSTQTNDIESSGINVSKEALDTLNSKITSMESSQSKLKTELSSLKDELGTLEKNKEKVSKEDQKNLSSEIETLSDKVNEIDALSDKVNEIDALSDKVNEIDALSDKVNEIDALKQEITNIQEHVPDIESITSKFNDLSDKLKDLTQVDSSLKNLEKLITPLISVTEQIAVLENKTAAIEEEFDTVKIMIGRLMQVIQKVANALKEEETAHHLDSTTPRKEWVSSDDLDFLDNISDED
ncbi:MAG: GTP-binding protein [Candidatus Kariarchaeaceae archaeon]